MNEINLLDDFEEAFSCLNKSGIINGYECIILIIFDLIKNKLNRCFEETML